jgi:protein O-mannosyl-transferase
MIPARSASVHRAVEWRDLAAPPFLAAALLLLAMLAWAYGNHFHNPFQFDDSHTIVSNSVIRDLHNVPRFFTDGTTSSTLPANQAWRPGFTTLNAIDTWLSGGVPNPFWFHVSIFASYVLLGVVLFFVYLHVLRRSLGDTASARWAALIGTGWFWMHTANAETIDYVSARSDSFSTFMVLLALALYCYSKRARHYLLFLVPVVVGSFFKETAIMFAPILLVYLWLFGDPDQERKTGRLHVAASFVLGIALFLLSRAMTPHTWTSGGGPWYRYLATQAFVVVHYFNNFLLPVNLSADTDWRLVTSVMDDRVLAGALFIGLLLLLAWACARNDRTKPVTFGILWFFIALAPTSSVFSFAEVLNDHRTFFPYIGLVLAAVCGALYVRDRVSAGGTRGIRAVAGPIPAIALGFLVITAHAIGARHRNEVWSSGRTLWKDVIDKSPGNGRGWMNYGLALMEANDVQGAIACFTKALALYPGYSYAHINMGVALSRVGQNALAEQSFRAAIAADSLNPEGYHFYGRFLAGQRRSEEALDYLERGRAISPAHEGINEALASLQTANGRMPVAVARDAVARNPTPDNYVNLSLSLYQAGDFPGSAQAASQALSLNPNYGVAWNNLAAAYNKTGEFEKAEGAGKRAVELQPRDALSKANYDVAVASAQRFAGIEANARARNDYDSWVAASLAWYQAGNYGKSIAAAEAAIKVNPNDALAWNNICAAANKTGDWDRAIAAGERSVKLNPALELASNNLAEARRRKQAAGAAARR